jgi:putative transposase
MQQIQRRRQSAQAWRGVLASFSQSGLTVEGYCQREGICRSSFYRWRLLLGGTQEEPRSQSVAHTGAGFVDLGTLKADSSRLELRLDLGGGVLLQLTRG